MESGRSRFAEDRRLKAAGVGLLVVAGAVLAKLAASVDAAQPTDPRMLGHLVLGVLAAVNVGAVGVLTLAIGCGQDPPWRTPRRRRALVLRVLLANVLVPPVTYLTLTSDDRVAANIQSRGWDDLASAGAAVFMLIAWRMWQRADRMEAVDAESAMEQDPRPPVLYLRAFADDGAAVLDDPRLLWVRLASWLRPISPEQELVSILGGIGPVVAIGRPGEVLPELGAARLYVAHDEWQRRVVALMRSASLVVIRVGRSAGVQWEIDTALAEVPRARLIFVLAGSAESLAAIDRLATTLGANLSAVAPEPIRRRYRSYWKDPKRRIGGLVGFNQAGDLVTVPVTEWPPWGPGMWGQLVNRPSALPLRRACRQLFTQKGNPDALTGGGRSRAVAVLLAVFFGYLGLHWFYLGQRRKGWTYVCLLPLALAPMFLGWSDALRFLWHDHATFQSRWVAAQPVAT